MEYNFSASTDHPPGSKLGTIWISMPLSFVSLENGNLSPIELNYASAYYSGLYLDSNPFLWSLSLEYFNLEIYFDGQELKTDGYELPTPLYLTQDNVNFCGDDYILIPIDVYAQSEFFAIGTFEFYIDLSFGISDEYFYLYTPVFVEVDPGKYINRTPFVLLIIFYYITVILTSFIAQMQIIHALLQGHRE